MSDISDRVHEAFHELAGKKAEQEGGAAFSLISNQDQVEKSPLSNNFMAFDHVWSLKFYGIMRRQYRHQAGTDNPESYPLMHEKVKELLTKPLTPFFLQCIAAGMQVGEQQSLLVRRAIRLGRLHELYGREEFTSEVALQAMGWEDDYELKEHLERYLEGSSVALASSIGLPNQSDPDVIARAWDVWAVSGRSMTVLCYSVGEMLGKQNRENDIIAHAAKEMESNSDDS